MDRLMRRQQDMDEDEHDTDLMQIMMTLLLNCSDRLRGLEGTYFYLLVGERSKPTVMAGQEAYQAYMAIMESLAPKEKANHNKGPPHIHIFQAVFKNLVDGVIWLERLLSV